MEVKTMNAYVVLDAINVHYVRDVLLVLRKWLNAIGWNSVHEFRSADYFVQVNYLAIARKVLVVITPIDKSHNLVRDKTYHREFSIDILNEE